MLCFVFGAFKAIKHLIIKSQEINSEYFVLNRTFCTLSKNHVRISFYSSLVKAYCILTYSLVPEPSEEQTRACTLEYLWNQAN